MNAMYYQSAFCCVSVLKLCCKHAFCTILKQYITRIAYPHVYRACVHVKKLRYGTIKTL